MGTIKYFGAAIILIGFFYFIFIRAINTKNYNRKSLFVFIAGLVITLMFVCGMGYDIYKGYFKILKQDIKYFSFLIVSILYMIVIPLIYFILGNSRKQKFQNNFKKITSIPTIKDKNEFVYIILKSNNSFYLKKIAIKDDFFYQGIIVKFGRKEYFHDEVVKQFILENKLDIVSYRYIGKAIKKNKVDNVYYCYRVLLNDIPTCLNNYELIDAYKLLSTNLHEDDKKILFTSVVNEDFNIEL